MSKSQMNFTKFDMCIGFTKFDMCIGVVEIWFGIAHWQISSNFDSVIYRDMIITGYYRFTFLYLFVRHNPYPCIFYLICYNATNCYLFIYFFFMS